MKMVFILLLLCAFRVEGQDTGTSIRWSPDKKLVFGDFAGQLDSSNKHGAISFCDLNDVYLIDYDTLEYNIFAFFRKDKSWMKVNDTDLLFHEQMHFNIAEIYSRSVKKKLNLLANKKVDDSAVYRIFIAEVEKINELNSQFDFETRHGTLEQATKIWAEKINFMLDSLLDFEKPQGKIHIRPIE
ncbi:MAG: hypothetical protein KF744_12585 [Taibaiella sp.]|nr:hypothetical protein [Taibaiella sp.]